MKKHKLVIILVNYNGFDITKDCLNSIDESEMPYVVLVDNASENPEQLELLKENYPLLHIIQNDFNFGFAKANNIGIEWAKENIDFEFLMLLNNDTVVTKNACLNLTEHFKKPNIGIVSCRIMFEYTPELVWYGGAYINMYKYHPQVADYGLAPTKTGSLVSRSVEFMSGCLMMFSKESITKLGGFDGGFFMYVEDLELCIRCKKEGMILWYDADTVIYHKVQGSVSKDLAGKEMLPEDANVRFQWTERKKNQWFTFKKHLAGLKFIRFVIFYWAWYHVLLLRLLIKSPLRKQVVLAHIDVLKAVMRGKEKSELIRNKTYEK